MAAGKILVVDDSPTDLAVICGPLRKDGYTVTTAQDASEALRHLERETPDLMLLDVVMPGISGFELCRNLRDDPRYDRLPIIFVTSKNLPSDMVWGKRNGGNDYITKPFASNNLLAMVRRYL